MTTWDVGPGGPGPDRSAPTAVPTAAFPTQPMPSYGAESPASPHPPSSPTPTPPRRGIMVALVATSTLLLLALGFGGYMSWVANGWQQRALSAQTRNAELDQQNATLSDELITTQEQLDASNDRLLELAGEKAQTADEREAQRQLAEQNAALAEQQNQIAVTAADAASKLAVCATSQDQLLELVLAQTAPAELNPLVDQVNADCRAAQEASAALARLLDR